MPSLPLEGDAKRRLHLFFRPNWARNLPSREREIPLKGFPVPKSFFQSGKKLSRNQKMSLQTFLSHFPPSDPFHSTVPGLTPPTLPLSWPV